MPARAAESGRTGIRLLRPPMEQVHCRRKLPAMHAHNAEPNIHAVRDADTFSDSLWDAHANPYRPDGACPSLLEL